MGIRYNRRASYLLYSYRDSAENPAANSPLAWTAEACRALASGSGCQSRLRTRAWAVQTSNASRTPPQRVAHAEANHDLKSVDGPASAPVPLADSCYHPADRIRVGGEHEAGDAPQGTAPTHAGEGRWPLTKHLACHASLLPDVGITRSSVCSFLTMSGNGIPSRDELHRHVQATR